ncbi:MAG: response regulator [Thermomonas sp.]|uniref:response regulator n=1 Tax=Thermomonas sp. TaxID=1971895 RepID=UPI0039E21E45
MSGKTILLVEDNPDEAELTRIAFAQSGCECALEVAGDGVEALGYLRARAGKTLPAVVLLDMNLPKLDGREVLQALRADPATRTLPVVVLSTSAEPGDVAEMYALGANSYVQKPMAFASFVEMVRRIGQYWLSLNQLPGRG